MGPPATEAVAGAIAPSRSLTPLYPRLGELLYDTLGKAEAGLYGFREDNIDIGEMSLSTYQGGSRSAKTAVVLLHGYSADKQLWPRFARHLVKEYRVLIPDLAGHGKTAFDAAWDYSGPAQARRVAVLMDQLGVERAHIVGNSMGGFIATHFALAYPERTASLCPMDPYGVIAPQESDADRIFHAGRNPFEIDTRAQFDEFYAMTMAKPPWMPGILLAGAAQRYRRRKPELARIYQGFANRDLLEDRLAAVTVPGFIVWGRLDRLLHVSAADIWAERLPRSRLLVLDGIGHMPMVECPSAMAKAYKEFLGELR